MCSSGSFQRSTRCSKRDYTSDCYYIEKPLFHQRFFQTSMSQNETDCTTTVVSSLFSCCMHLLPTACVHSVYFNCATGPYCIFKSCQNRLVYHYHAQRMSVEPGQTTTYNYHPPSKLCIFIYNVGLFLFFYLANVEYFGGLVTCAKPQHLPHSTK